ncbi:CBS domain-containing protein [Streptomyces populi]|uniref:CBS domain-containing protein n=1 Tax=Streptomyces populi TaxID=2058924 RepID=UPI003B847F6A
MSGPGAHRRRPGVGARRDGPAEAALPEATRPMTRHGIERLPVVDEKDRLVDIVSRRDLLQVFLRSAEGVWQAVRREVFADALRLGPRSPKSPSTTVRSRSPGSWEAARRHRRGGSDAPAGRCRRRRGRPHLPLRRQAHTGHRTDRARNGRRPAAWVMSPRTPPTGGRPCGHGGQSPSARPPSAT